MLLLPYLKNNLGHSTTTKSFAHAGSTDFFYFGAATILIHQVLTPKCQQGTKTLLDDGVTQAYILKKRPLSKLRGGYNT